MRERGLALSPMMARATVRAISPKTMTRRLVNPPRGYELVNLRDSEEDDRYSGRHDDPTSWGYPFYEDSAPAVLSDWLCLCPYGVPGDRLWGREAYRTHAMFDSLPPRVLPKTAPIWYEADGKAPPEFGRYRHGRFMMRWMARIVREVTSVAAERLSSISEVDAMREGIERDGHVIVGAHCAGGHHHEITATRYFIPGLHEEQEQPALDEVPGFAYATSAFFRLWEILHGPGSVEADPWLWVIGYGPVPAP